MLNRIEHMLATAPSGALPLVGNAAEAISLNGARPETMDEFVGQNHLKALIKTSVASSTMRNSASAIEQEQIGVVL